MSTWPRKTDDLNYIMTCLHIFTAHCNVACDFNTPVPAPSVGLRGERQQIYNASQSNWIQQTVNGRSVLCYCGQGQTKERRSRRRGQREKERGIIALEFCVQSNMSHLLGVRRWPYVGMFHIAFFLLISVQNMAHRNTGRRQAKVTQRSRWAWCIQNTRVDTKGDEPNPISVCLCVCSIDLHKFSSPDLCHITEVTQSRLAAQRYTQLYINI